MSFEMLLCENYSEKQERSQGKNRKQEIRIMTKEEVVEVLLWLKGQENKRKELVFSLAVFSGLRESEIATLEWRDVMAGRSPKKWFVPTKPKKGNRMPALMNEISGRCLIEMVKNGKDVVGIGRKSVWSIWDSIQKKVWGYRAYRFHDLRHTAITRYYEHTRDIWKTKEFARHTELSTTQKYIHLAERPEMEQALREIVREVSVEKVVGVIGL